MSLMRIQSGAGAYEVNFSGKIADLAPRLPQGHRIWVVDQRVLELHGTDLRALSEGDPLLPVPVNEDLKSLEGAGRLCERLIDVGIRRPTHIVAVGGGILQDLAGFAASVLFRGVPWVFLPTTLLAQADSCIGGKTSLNFHGAKNLLGTFWTPRQVMIVPAFLETLEEGDFFSGLGEVVKLHLMGGHEILETYERLQARLFLRERDALAVAIRGSLEVKQRYIERDEHDQGMRLLLNFGHCFGHALEAVSGFRIPHGQAVLAGIRLANRVALGRGLLDGALDQRVDALLQAALRNPPQPHELSPGPILEAMGRDKKRTGKGLALILMKSGLQFEQVQDLSPDEAEAALALESGNA